MSKRQPFKPCLFADKYTVPAVALALHHATSEYSSKWEDAEMSISLPLNIGIAFQFDMGCGSPRTLTKDVI